MNRGLLYKAGIVAVILAGIGLFVGTQYIDRKEQKKVQSSVEDIQKKDTLDMKKADLDSEDQSWQRKLAKKANGNPDVVIVADNIDQSLHDVMYSRMQELDWQGVMVLTDGKMPDGQDGRMTAEQFAEMTASGWDYAFAISEDVGESGIAGWLTALDQDVAKWTQAGMVNPGIAVCRADQYPEEHREEMKQELLNRGFRALLIVCDNEITYAGAYDASWNTMESVFLKEELSNVTEMMQGALKAEQSMSVTLGRVTDQVQDESSELSPEKFEKFISQMQDMVNNGYAVLSYSAYESDRNAANEELAQMQSEYDAFLKDKEEQLKKLEE